LVNPTPSNSAPSSVPSALRRAALTAPAALPDGRVARLQDVPDEAFELGRRHIGRHQHRIGPVPGEQVIERLGRAHLGDGVAEDQEDTGGAGDVHERCRSLFAVTWTLSSPRVGDKATRACLRDHRAQRAVIERSAGFH